MPALELALFVEERAYEARFQWLGAGIERVSPGAKRETEEGTRLVRWGPWRAGGQKQGAWTGLRDRAPQCTAGRLPRSMKKMTTPVTDT